MNQLVEWSNLLPIEAVVAYSTLAIPDFDRDSLNSDVAEIALPAGLAIDVEWDDTDREYVVTLFRGDYEIIISSRCASASDVIETVKEIAQQYKGGHVATASSATMSFQYTM